jgi:hypothetical protein
MIGGTTTQRAPRLVATNVGETIRWFPFSRRHPLFLSASAESPHGEAMPVAVRFQVDVFSDSDPLPLARLIDVQPPNPGDLVKAAYYQIPRLRRNLTPRVRIYFS